MSFSRKSDFADPREKTLSLLTLVLGCIFWIVLIVCSLGTVLGICLAGFIVYLIAQSLLIAHIRGNGVEISERQYPSLHAQLLECCKVLEMSKRPQAYLLPGHGAINAFATRFLRQEFVILNAETVDAMADHPDGVAFYLGHELGHLRMQHLPKHFLRWPALWLPLLGAAYSRVKEATCDRHGRACCTTADGAARALGALATGPHQWRSLDLEAYCDQSRFSGGFWMSLHELFSPYPWLTRRVVRVLGLGDNLPKRHPLAFLIALFIPYAGRGGILASLVVYTYLAFVGSMIGMGIWTAHLKNDLSLPVGHAIMGETTPSTIHRQNGVVIAFYQSEPARQALHAYWIAHHEEPPSIEALGIAPTLPDGSNLSLGASGFPNLFITTHVGKMQLIPLKSPDGTTRWQCRPLGGYTASDMPGLCR